jgi:hypothetical protein
MTQILTITQGDFTDQLIMMKDVDADDAISHHFGFIRLNTSAISDDLYAQAKGLMTAADWPYLRAWEQRLRDPSYNPREVIPVNPPQPTPPTGLTLNPNSIKRDRLVDTPVGTLTAIDADQATGHMFTSADQNFKIGGLNGDQVLVAKRPGPAPGNYIMAITVRDRDGLSIVSSVTITIVTLADDEMDGPSALPARKARRKL